MKKLIVKDGYVIAVHDEEQIVEGLYPGCEVVFCANDKLPRADEGMPLVPQDLGLSYIEKRRAEYGSVGEQLDMLYKDIVAGTDLRLGMFADHIASVKAAVPKDRK